LPFSPLPHPEWFNIDVDSVQERYSLRQPYFLISNQFWVHKDHATAFVALSLIENRDIQLVCTGDTSDFRDPEHFPQIQKLIADLGLSKRVRILGHIPKSDQIGILRGAVAVVQPTLFEGGPGGGSVYDAVAMGAPAIVSDIPVNLEIQEEGVVFFPAGSAQKLAAAMTARLRSLRTPASRELLLQRGASRAIQLAAALTQAINSALLV
jgi:glycosyltransferase involved in cell wall biosynthesis